MRVQQTKGFGLVELVVTLALVALLGTMAMPPLMAMVRDNRMTSYANQIAASLMRARGEAIARRLTVTVCSSANGTACLGTLQAERGWITFVDQGVVGTVDGTDAILEVHTALPADLTARSSTFVALSFNNRGLPTAAGALQLRFCDGRGAASAREIVINGIGNLIRPPMGKNQNGGALTCPT